MKSLQIEIISQFLPLHDNTETDHLFWFPRVSYDVYNKYFQDLHPLYVTQIAYGIKPQNRQNISIPIDVEYNPFYYFTKDNI
jgi:hypothetical protein